MHHENRTPATGAGDVLVRLRATDRAWAAALPPVPAGEVLTVTVGHPQLLPTPADDLVAGGYRIVGVAATADPLGLSVDVLVPGHLRVGHPAWWERFAPLAERVFDLRLGPVQQLLAAQLADHAPNRPGAV